MKQQHRPHHRRRLAAGLSVALPVLVMALAAAAKPDTDPTRESATDPRRPSICGSGREAVTLEVDGRQLSVVHQQGDRVTTTVVDMDQVGRLVGDAVGEAMTAMHDMQMQVRLGQDNRINITTAEGAIEVDLDQIMTQVAAAVQTGFAEFDTDSWASTDSVGEPSEEDLQRELADLQDEMRALREELRRLRDGAERAPTHQR